MAVKESMMESAFSFRLQWSLILGKLQAFIANGLRDIVTESPKEFAFSFRLW